MDFYSFVVAIIAALLGYVGFHGVVVLQRKRRQNSEKSGEGSGAAAPEPPRPLPFIGHLLLLRGRVPIGRTLGALADKYGPIYSLRLGCRRALVVSSWEAIKECFTTNDAVFVTRPSMTVGKHLAYDNAVMALAPYGAYWVHLRKTVVHEVLSKQRLEKLKHVRAWEVRSAVKGLRSECTKAVEMSKWVEHLTLNISLRMVVGKRDVYPCQQDDWHFKEALKRAFYLSGLFLVSDAIPWLEWMDIGGHVKAMKRTAKELDRVVAKWLHEHLQKRPNSNGNGDSDSDFMDVMISTLAVDDVVRFGHKRDTIIKATVLVLIMAGTESPADTIIWALSLLLNNQEALERVQEELDVHVGRAKWVEESDVKKLTYLEAVVKETLRLYPSGPVGGPREALEDCYVGGYYVPKGTCLVVNLWKLHRDPRIWSSPDEFEPERFLIGRHANANADVRGGHQHLEYLPFSSGRRMCPGVTYALQVVHLTLASLLQGFDVSSTPTDIPVDMSEGFGLTLPKASPLRVVLKPRLPMHMY